MNNVSSVGTTSRFPGRMLDRIGIGISAFCLLQCLALPLALVFAPIASAGLLDHGLFHLVLLAVIIPVSLLAFTLGFMRHRNLRMWVPAAIGFALLIFAAVLEQGHVVGPGWIAAPDLAGRAWADHRPLPEHAKPRRLNASAKSRGGRKTAYLIPDCPRRKP